MKTILTVVIFLSFAECISGQVPVRDEPRHRPVLVNEYIRLLDVWLPPGDTSLFHMHATPSLFVVLKNAQTSSQVMGGKWMMDQYESGKPWYRSFVNDTFVHRVANIDTTSFHVNDIELLKPFDTTSTRAPLPFELLFQNEKAFTYRVTSETLNEMEFTGRGPIIIHVIAGDVTCQHLLHKTSRAVKSGNYHYIEPGTTFKFASPSKGLSVILFEVK